MSSKSIESWKGIEITYEGRRIVRARYKRGYPQKWHVIPERHYGSKQELLAYKETEKLNVGLTVPDSMITFGEYWPTVMEARASMSDSTKASYRYRLIGPWVQPLHKEKLVKIEREHILALVRRWKMALAEEGRELYLENLQSVLTPIQMVFTYAIRNGHYRGTNPVAAIMASELAAPKPKKKTLVLKPGSEALAKLFEAVNDKHRCLFALAFYTGGRISELLGLRWEHIDMKQDNPLDNTVTFEGQRNARTGEWDALKHRESHESRVVDLPAAALPYLREQLMHCGLNRRPEDPVFPGLVQVNVQKYIAGNKKRGGHHWGLRDKLGPEFDGTGRWEPFTLHHLRHSFGSLLIEAGLDVRYVAAQMGNTMQVLMKTYAHEIEAAQREPTRRSGYVMDQPVAL